MNKRLSQRASILAVVFLLFLLSLVAIVQGCYGPKKANRQHARAVATFPDLAKSFCRDNFPVKEKLVPGRDIVRIDTTYLPGTITTDTIKGADSIQVITITREKPARVINKTILRTDTLYQENTARLAMCDTDRAALVALLAQQNRRTQSLQRAARLAAGLCAVLGVAVFVLLRRGSVA